MKILNSQTKIFGSLRCEIVHIWQHIEPFGSRGCRNHRYIRSHCFENFYPSPTAKMQWNHGSQSIVIKPTYISHPTSNFNSWNSC